MADRAGRYSGKMALDVAVFHASSTLPLPQSQHRKYRIIGHKQIAQPNLHANITKYIQYMQVHVHAHTNIQL
jgi:hypothetical protein